MEISQADKTVLSTLFGEEVVTRLSGALPETEGELSLGLNLGGKKLYDPEDVVKKANIGRDAGIEIGYKNVAKEAGVDLMDGEKDPKIIISKYKQKIVSELEEQYKNPKPTEELERAMKKALDFETKYTQLNETFNLTKQEVEEWKSKYEKKEVEIKEENLNNKILTSLPKKMVINEEDALLIAKNNLVFDADDDGKEVIRDKRSGKLYVDGASNPLELKDVLKLIAEDRGWVGSNPAPDGGNGNGQPRAVKGLSMEQAIEKIKKEGLDPMSTEGLIKYREYTKK